MKKPVWTGFLSGNNLKSLTEILKWLGLSVLAFVLVAAGAVAHAQQTTKVPLIGILGSSSISGAARSQAIRQALREIGYIEGKNIAIEERYHEGTRDRRQRAEIAAQLVRLNQV